jgi:hypothetical protein
VIDITHPGRLHQTARVASMDSEIGTADSANRTGCVSPVDADREGGASG